MTERADADATAVRAVVHGEVQGVGYRDATLRRARRLGVMGWVRNAEDGSLHVHAEGPERAVEEMVSFLHDGPPAARVTEVAIERVRVEGHEQFAIRGVSAGSFVVAEHAARTRHFDLRPSPGEDRSFVADRLRRLKPKQQLGTALGTRILRQQQNTRLRSLGSKTIAMPGCQRHTRDELRGKAAHVQHDCAETSALKQKVCSPQRLLNPCPWLGREGNSYGGHRGNSVARLKCFLLRSNPRVRLRA